MGATVCSALSCHDRLSLLSLITYQQTCRAGLILGYISAIAYLKSRVSQLVKNCTRGDADGLSASMFIWAITGNVTGAAGIILRLDTAKEFIWQLPWLIGMLGTVAMDVVIASQSASAAAHHRHRTDTLGNTRDAVQIDATEGGSSDSTEPLLDALA